MRRMLISLLAVALFALAAASPAGAMRSVDPDPQPDTAVRKSGPGQKQTKRQEGIIRTEDGKVFTVPTPPDPKEDEKPEGGKPQ